MRTLAPGLAASLLLALGTGCATPPGAGAGPARTSRNLESPTAHALPESDPGQRGMVQGSRLLTETEQVAVRLGRAADGRIVLLQVLSPGFSPQQEEALRRGFESGEWQRDQPVAPAAESWIENLVRARH